MRIFPKGLSWTIALMVVPVLVFIGEHAHAQSKKKPAPVPAPVPIQQNKPDPSEEQYACGLGTLRDRNGDHCKCPVMVAEVRDEQIDKCYSGPPAQFDECMKKSHDVSECDIVRNADLKHPAHSCNRYCSTKSVCRCHDGPACIAPPIPHPSEGDDQQ